MLLLHSLSKVGFKVDFAQVDRRHACTGQKVGNIAAEVRIDCGRAGNAENHGLVLFLEAFQKEDAGLFAFNQENGSFFIVDFGLSRDSCTNDNFIEVRLGQTMFGDVELDVN